MKKISLSLILIINIIAASLAFAGKEILPSQEPDSAPINMSEPPFWMSSYDEFNDLQDSQKQFYLEKLLPQMGKIPSLQDKKQLALKDASEWYQSWNHIRLKVYQYCQDQTVQKNCEDLANIRVQALGLFANQKLENRKAEAKNLNTDGRPESQSHPNLKSQK